ncbi:MAG TPA: DUF402 domain-containing protein [Bacilli bacterium]|nr:DUF402 domain-containing protein [Bacilli bacterium]HPS18914.1 DUF402 domain-containing protein [Bacilli bacterium]
MGRWLGIQCYKHNGNLHRCWDRGFVLDNNHDFLIVASRRAKVVENNGRSWFTKEPAITIFSKREWWNVICMIKEDGVCFYCNIASPSLVDNDIIKYIDYDLDAKLFPNGEVRVLDEKEYAHHRDSFGYDDELDMILKYTMQNVVDRMKNRDFPFDEKAVKDYYNQFLEMNVKKE